MQQVLKTIIYWKNVYCIEIIEEHKKDFSHKKSSKHLQLTTKQAQDASKFMSLKTISTSDTQKMQFLLSGLKDILDFFSNILQNKS